MKHVKVYEAALIPPVISELWIFKTRYIHLESELRSCVKVEVDILGSPSLTEGAWGVGGWGVRGRLYTYRYTVTTGMMVSVDVKQH